MLFIVMFIIQWTASSIFGVWDLIEEAPPVVALLTVMLANAGGILNGIVFVVTYRKPPEIASDTSYHERTKRNTVTTTNTEC